MALTISAIAQTPGLIIKPATGGGSAILDPDGDGYVSQKTNGIQKGFTIPPDNDVTQSEIPYVALVRPDVQGDLERGPTGGFTEIVGTDAAGNNAILTYSDNNYLYYRFRLSGYAPNSKSYSILIDTDQKFGFTGPNADPDAVTGNPGFEVEIVLETNFNVFAYNVNGSATRPETATASALYDTNCQKSVAVSAAGGDLDYFYDFYLPYPTTLFTKNTPLRYVALTSMNPFPAIGNNAVSDVGGVGSFTNLDQAFTDLVTTQTPTLPGQEVVERSACTTVNPVSVTSTQISGTINNASNISYPVIINVYKNTNATLLGTATISSGLTWSINGITGLMTGDKIFATAQEYGKGLSYENCDIKTVTSCTVQTSIPTSTEVRSVGGDKGFSITINRPVGTKVYLYDSNYSLLSSSLFKNSTANPYITTANPQTISFECQKGNCFGTDVYYFRFEEPGKCISPYYLSCDYSTGVSAAPVITSTSLNILSTTVSGTGTTANSKIFIYADNAIIATATSGAVSPYLWSANVSNISLCQVITAQQMVAGQCVSPSSNAVIVSRMALKPTISNSGCSVSSPVSSVSGTSSEADNTVITLYTPNSSGTSLGTTTVSSGVWTKSGLSLTSGTTIVAKVTSGPCLTESPESAPITISTQTNINSFPITFNSVIEKQSSVSGTISGITASVTLNLYVDKSYIGTTTINSNGNWSVSGINPYDLYVGGKIQATVTGNGCESALSSTYVIVECLAPAMPSYVGGSKTYCMGGPGQVALTTSETGVIYQLVNASGVEQGPSATGTGSGITLYTYALNSNLTGIYVKAYKIGTSACAIVSTNAINFDSVNPSPSITFTNTSLSVAKGTTSVSLPFSARSSSPSADKYTIDYSLASNNQGFLDVTTQSDISGSAINLTVPVTAATGTYTGTITIYSNSGACTTSYNFTIAIYLPGSPPVISSQPVNATICSGATKTISVTASSSTSITYQWQYSTSYSGTYTNIGTNSSSYTTIPLSTTSYYRVVLSNGFGSVTSNVATVTVTATAAAAGAISGTSTVCAGQNGVNYSVETIANANTYTWMYSGTGAFINGTGSSVYINFGYNATSGTLSVAGTNSCGSGTVSSYVITVNPLTVVAAGNDQTTCSSSGAVNITSGASASVGSTVVWTSNNGTGTFANANSLTDATYTPGQADITRGSVNLTLTATGSCGSVTSSKTLAITTAPLATAGTDISVCTGMAAISMTGATASGTYTGTPTWSGGEAKGTWTQNANPALATFTPSAASGSFTATLTLTGCSNATSSRTITWGTTLTATFTASPGADACINESVTYTTESGKANYIWTVPGVAGIDYSITAGGIGTASNTVTIKWLKSGNKTVTVKYSDNGCLSNIATSFSTIHDLPPIGIFN